MSHAARDESNLATTYGAVVIVISRALAHCGVDPGPVFQSAGVEFNVERAHETRYPSLALQKLWRRAVEVTGDPCFGLGIAQHINPLMYNGLGFAFVSSDTLGAALQRLLRFYRLLSTAVQLDLRETPVSFDLVARPRFSNPEPASADAAMSFLLTLCRKASSPDLNPSWVLLQRTPPPCPERFREFFRAPIAYDAPENILSFEKSTLDAVLPCANPGLARANDEVVISYLARFDRDNIRQRVLAQIIEQLPDGAPTQDAIAEALHMSARNLQRRLQDDNTSYRSLLDQTRQELAQQYLREGHRSIGEITYLLGFTEPANFSRAFKRWTGRTPQEYRARP